MASVEMPNLDDAQFNSLLPRTPEVTETAVPTATWTSLTLPSLGDADRFWVRLCPPVACQVRFGGSPSTGLPIPANTLVELGPYAIGTEVQVRQSSGSPVTLAVSIEHPSVA